MVAGPRRAGGAATDACRSPRRAPCSTSRSAARAVSPPSPGRWTGQSIKRAAGVTVNDVVLAMCSGALRYYLLDEQALPDTPLIAMVPVSMRSEDEADSGGNMVGASCATWPPTSRIRRSGWRRSAQSMRGNKKVFSELPRLQAFALSAFLHRAAGTVRAAGLRLVGAAAVQHRHLQRAGADRADVLGRRPPRRQLPAVDRAGRAGVEHHDGQQRRQHRFRLGRMPAKCAAPAAAARSPGKLAERFGARGRESDCRCPS